MTLYPSNSYIMNKSKTHSNSLKIIEKKKNWTKMQNKTEKI